MITRKKVRPEVLGRVNHFAKYYVARMLTFIIQKKILTKYLAVLEVEFFAYL